MPIHESSLDRLMRKILLCMSFIDVMVFYIKYLLLLNVSALVESRVIFIGESFSTSLSLFDLALVRVDNTILPNRRRNNNKTTYSIKQASSSY